MPEMPGSPDTHLSAVAIDSVARAWAVVVVATCKENLSVDSVAVALRPRLQGVEALFARAHEDRLRDLQERLRWLTREVCKAAGIRGDVEVAAIVARIRELRALAPKRTVSKGTRNSRRKRKQ